MKDACIEMGVNQSTKRIIIGAKRGRIPVNKSYLLLPVIDYKMAREIFKRIVSRPKRSRNFRRHTIKICAMFEVSDV